jgi:glucose-1-phosphate thymidylyltransferase
MAVLLIENNEYQRFYPIARTRFLWDITTGIFTPYQRYDRQFHNIKVYSPRFEKKPYSFLKEELGNTVYQQGEKIHTVLNSQFIPFENLSPQINRIGITKEGKFVYIRLEEIGMDIIESIVNNELEGLLSKFSVKEIDGGIYLDDISDIIKNNAKAIEYETYLIKNDGNFVSPNNQIYIDKTAKIQQFVSLQADEGPIIIDKGAVVRSFSIIEGPSYIGKNSLIDSAKIRGGSTIKDVCKVGGEVEASVIESYSNKHHEGFLGHSYVGSWVNIGAMATTSDLKNNYGNIRIQIEDETLDTGTNKFGSIICDYSKIGIGLMLSTGTVISEGSSLFLDGKELPKFVKPFSWGSEGQYEINRFIEDTRKIMTRRKASLSENQEKFLRGLYKI